MSLRLYLLRTMSVSFVAVALAGGLGAVAQAVAVEPNDLMQCEYRESASTEQEALANAGMRGVRAAVGRLLCSEYGLQARELLMPYIDANWQKYVSSSMVLDRRVDRDGVGVFCRVLVTPEKLMRDLREKKFLYKPTAVPATMVFLYETMDGQPVDSAKARDLAGKSVLAAGGRVATPEVVGLSQGEFVLRDNATAMKALETASRAGAEVVLTGIVQTAKVKEETVLFDPMSTYETTVTLAVFRKDDLAVTGKADFVERATDKNADVAANKALELALNRAASQVTADTLKEWNAHYGNGANFMVLLTFADQSQTAQFQRHLETELGRGTRAYLKSWYGNTAVFSMVTPCSASDVEKAINSCSIGSMRITDRIGKRITVEPRY